MNKYLRLIRFDKPIGTLLLLWPTLLALLIAYHGKFVIYSYVVFTLGVFLTRSAGCAINDFADKDFDSKVERTKQRPLATGELQRKDAIIVTLLLSIVALIMAVVFLQLKTLIWTIPAFLIFVSYPFFKRFFPMPQLYLAIAFSIGIFMVFIEANQGLRLVSVILFCANLCWVLAYDTIYALVDIDDDLKIGIKTSAITFGSNVISIIGACYAAFILLLISIGLLEHLNVFYWLGISIATGVIVKIMLDIKNKDRQKCFKAFLFNNNIGIALAVGLFLSYR